MVVGVLRLALLIRGARSLKDKRSALRRIIERVRARYNVSIAEVGDNDIWQRALVGVTAVANDRSFVNEVLDKVVRDVEMLGVADLVGREMELETYSEMHERPDKPMLDEPPPMPQSEEQAAREEAEALAEYLREDDFGPEGGGR
ncbi:MAG: DUF503 domain-containing protein [Deltaproteobacteria bacterium]|nr:MAG: DUF503 domain-containing protein [Deltaproteobacteria bacterium]TMB28853.1 MAG: DUF503 domain-containing protein [Deltaproteobacteria bacterium]TMB32103.1 MAG: DUF503 domain-containing protein [Deltaproteobacteria bacterium]